MDHAAEAAAPTVIIVDDDAGVLGSLTFAFETAGFRVDAHASAEALLTSQLRRERCCLVLDYRLPGMDGLALLERLREQGLEAPAVLITTPDAEVIRRAAAAGVPLIEKPLLSGALASQVCGLLADQA